jgi:hypothetical protein
VCYQLPLCFVLVSSYLRLYLVVLCLCSFRIVTVPPQKVLTRVFELREELLLFFKDNNKASFSDFLEGTKWLLKLAYLVDVYQHLNTLNSSMRTPSFGREVKPSVPCRRFTACKRTLGAR